MNTGARLLSFNSSSVMDGSSSFSCHLELYHSLVNFGFFVFIQEMELSGSTAGGCREDFLQFGRDILFVTTHLSERYCGKVERPRLKTNLAGASSQISHRSYTENSDLEMDIWLHVGAMKSKSLVLVVTPMKQSCESSDTLYQQCGRSGVCVRKELICDGMVNCPFDDGVWRGNWRI